MYRTCRVYFCYLPLTMVHVWEFENQFCLAQNSMCATVLSISDVKSLMNTAFDDSALLATCLLHKERILHLEFFST